MSKEQVEEHISRIREELDREREERNYFQLERDKIHTFWEITRRQLEEKKAELRNKDREMEEAEERHQVEIKVYKQKVKHLLYEHQNNLTEMKAEGTVVMKLAQKEHRTQEGALRKDMRALKVELKEQELANEVVVKNLRLKHTEEITKMRNDFERQVREIEAKYDKKMKMLRDELDLRRKTEIHEVEERKNGQINALMQRHEEAFTDIKNYYNDITLNNLALINSLKEQMEDMRKKEDHLEKEMMEVSTQNRRLADPLQKARDDMNEMQKKLGSYERDKQILLRTKARLKVAEKELKDLQWEHEVLEQRFVKVQQERDELYRKFTAAILEVQQKVGFKNLVLERKMQALSAAVEKKEAQFNEVLAASNLDPAALTLVSRKLEDVLESKNSTIKDLQYELARVCKVPGAPAPSRGPTLSTPWRYTWPEAVWAFSGHSVCGLGCIPTTLATVLVSLPGSAQWLSGPQRPAAHLRGEAPGLWDPSGQCGLQASGDSCDWADAGPGPCRTREHPNLAPAQDCSPDDLLFHQGQGLLVF
ncbi:dynein regulatory complex subunit 4 isoform X1 [Mustela lutreola]|nr:dynein regulatory complex subunit 4 isoform X1 [Mustela lutreola]